MVTKVINFTHSPLSMYLESLETYHDHEFSVILLFQQWMWLQHFLSNPQNSSAQKWSRHIFIHLGGYQVKTCQEPHLTAGASALRRFDRTRQSWRHTAWRQQGCKPPSACRGHQEEQLDKHVQDTHWRVVHTTLGKSQLCAQTMPWAADEQVCMGFVSSPRDIWSPTLPILDPNKVDRSMTRGII